MNATTTTDKPRTDFSCSCGRSHAGKCRRGGHHLNPRPEDEAQQRGQVAFERGYSMWMNPHLRDVREPRDEADRLATAWYTGWRQAGESLNKELAGGSM